MMNRQFIVRRFGPRLGGAGVRRIRHGDLTRADLRARGFTAPLGLHGFKRVRWDSQGRCSEWEL